MTSILKLSRMMALPLVLGFVSLAAHAGVTPFDKTQFDAALAAGKPTAVHFSATWCPTCKVQAPLVSALLAEPRFKDLTVFVADYDKELAFRKQLKITQQSTFVVYKAGNEVTRSTGEIDKAAIAQVLARSL